MIVENCGEIWRNFVHRFCFCSRVDDEDPEYIGDYDESEEDLLLPKKTITNIMVISLDSLLSLLSDAQYCFIAIIISFGVGAYSEELIVKTVGPFISILGLIVIPILCGIPLYDALPILLVACADC
jgi:hypothetical protein